ncbi:hypothetical protein T08_6424 [Trichinella sp. T8]|nr:hypothetical protein T08_6424 [Trichinella sp. T8]
MTTSVYSAILARISIDGVENQQRLIRIYYNILQYLISLQFFLILRKLRFMFDKDYEFCFLCPNVLYNPTISLQHIRHDGSIGYDILSTGTWVKDKMILLPNCHRTNVFLSRLSVLNGLTAVFSCHEKNRCHTTIGQMDNRLYNLISKRIFIHSMDIFWTAKFQLVEH